MMSLNRKCRCFAGNTALLLSMWNNGLMSWTIVLVISFERFVGM